MGGAIAVFLLSRSPDRTPHLEAPTAAATTPPAEPEPTPPPLAAEPGPTPTSATPTAHEEEAPASAPTPSDRKPGPTPEPLTGPGPVAAGDAPRDPAPAAPSPPTEPEATTLGPPATVVVNGLPVEPVAAEPAVAALTAPVTPVVGADPAAEAGSAAPEPEPEDGRRDDEAKLMLTAAATAPSAVAERAGSHAVTNPTTGTEWYASGRRLARSAPRDALYAFRRAATHGDSVAYRDIGRLEAARGHVAAAIAAYRRYLRARPRARDAERVRGEIRELGGR